MSHVDPTLDGQADDEDVAFYTQHHEALEKGIKQHGIEYFTAKKDIHSTGLSNQGATCYLNSLLQALFRLQPFREALFAWRYDERVHGPARNCIALQLQRLFATLALSAAPFEDTEQLTTSFGWEGEDVFEQHDVQELCRVLFEALSLSDLPAGSSTGCGQGEGGQGGEGREDTTSRRLPFSTLLPSLFSGSLTSRLTCCVCGHGSTPLCEPWMDVGVQVQARTSPHPPEGEGVESAGVVGPCSPWTDLHAALRAQSKSEVLEGADAWACPACAATPTTTGRTEAAAAAAPRAVRSTHLDWPLPPVLTFHLHRFGWDAAAGRYTKVTHPFSFPLTLTHTRAFTQAPWEDEGEEGQGDYHLSAVLLHAGNAGKGHYLAFVRQPHHTQGEGEGGGGCSWLLANDTGVSAHSEEQVAAALACTAGGPAACTAAAVKLPVGATPYLLLYSSRSPSPSPSLSPPLTGPLQYALYNGDHPRYAPLATQYGYAQGVLGAGLLPAGLQGEVHASNSAWAALSRAAALRPLMTRLSLHLPLLGRPVTTLLFARATDTLAHLTARAHRAWCCGNMQAQGVAVERVRLRLWEEGSSGGGGRMGQPLPGPGWQGTAGGGSPSPYTPASSLEGAGLAPAAALCLELHPSLAGAGGGWVRVEGQGGGWPLWSREDVTVRLLPWCTHLQAACADRAARAGGRGGEVAPPCSPLLPIPLRPTLAWDGGQGQGEGATSVMLHAALATLPGGQGGGSAAALAAACAALGGAGVEEGGGSRQWRLIVLPGGLPTPQDIQEGQAAARLRGTGRQGLRVITLPSQGEELALGEGDDIVLLPPSASGEEEEALSALSALYTGSSLRLAVRLSPALAAALAHPPSARALRAALSAWVVAHGGDRAGMHLTWPATPSSTPSSPTAGMQEPPLPLPAPHVLYSCCTATAAAQAAPPPPLLHVACSKEDSLATLLARALACALGGQLAVAGAAAAGGGRAAEGGDAASTPPLPVHGRRAARAPMWRVEDEGRSLAALDVGQGSGLMLCLGPALAGTLAVVRAWSLVGQGEGEERPSSLVLLGSTLCPLSARLQAVRKALHATLASQGLLGPSPHAVTPRHLRLRTLGRTGASSGGPGGAGGGAGGESVLLRDDGVLRTAVPALPGGGLAATVQVVVATAGQQQLLEALVLGRDTAPASLYSTGDERDVLLQLLPAPESIGREDLVVRVRQLLVTPAPLPLAGEEAPSHLAARRLALLASLHAVGGALGVWGGSAPPPPCSDPEAWLPALGLTPPSAAGGKEGVALGPVEELVLPRTASPASLAAALARRVSAGQRALLQLTAGESGLLAGGPSCEGEEEEGEGTVPPVPVPVRLARVSAHSPGLTAFDVGHLPWHGPLLVGAGEEGEGGVQGPAWAQGGTLMAAPLGLTDGCTLLWRADPCPCPAYPPALPQHHRPATASSPASLPTTSAGGGSPGGSDKENSGAGRSSSSGTGALRGSSGSGARAVAAARRASEAGAEGEGSTGQAPEPTVPLAQPVKPWLAARAAGHGQQRGCEDIVVLAGKPPATAAASAALLPPPKGKGQGQASTGGLQQASTAAENSGGPSNATGTSGGGVKMRMRGRAGESYR